MKKIVKKRETLKSQVYEYLREAIIHGDIAPGERLIEEKIADELQVSRSPIREAVRMLEKDGLLTVQRTGGVIVVNPSVDDYRELYECRVEIESLAAYYAAKRRSVEQLETIESHLLGIEEAIAPGQLRLINRENLSFHEAIVKASGNSILISMTGQLRGMSSFYRKTLLEAVPMHIEDTIADHKKITQAIANQDADKARQRMKEHVQRDYQVFMKLFTEK